MLSIRIDLEQILRELQGQNAILMTDRRYSIRASRQRKEDIIGPKPRFILLQSSSVVSRCLPRHDGTSTADMPDRRWDANIFGVVPLAFQK